MSPVASPRCWRRALDDAVELTELLRFIDNWLANDHDQLNLSLRGFVGHHSYGISWL